MSIPLIVDLKRDLYCLYGTFNKDFLIFNWFNYDESKESPDNHPGIMTRIGFESKQMSLPVSSKYQFGIVAILDDGGAILKYISEYGDKRGFIITR